MNGHEMMKAAVLNGPFAIDIEQRPKPAIENTADAIVKVSLAGICGSELHGYRGHQKTKMGHIMGHEFTGTVEAVGSEVRKFKVGDSVLCIFSTSCMSCWFCKHGYTNRCAKSLAVGTQQLDGGQAEFVRVPFADGTLKRIPEGVDEELMIMMSDIFPTGYYGAMRAISTFTQPPENVPNSLDLSGQEEKPSSGSPWLKQPLSDAVFVCLGCGPVGLCAILTAHAKGVHTIFAVDSVDDRLAEASKLGAMPLKLGVDDIQAKVLKATNGRGADAVIEVVGNKAALRSAFDLLRPCGTLSSIGFHQGEVPFTALECYSKSLYINLGRPPVTAVFDEALELLMVNRKQLANFVTHRLPLIEAAKGYELFEKQIARKVVLVP